MQNINKFRTFHCRNETTARETNTIWNYWVGDVPLGDRVQGASFGRTFQERRSWNERPRVHPSNTLCFSSVRCFGGRVCIWCPSKGRQIHVTSTTCQQRSREYVKWRGTHWLFFRTIVKQNHIWNRHKKDILNFTNLN